jgi:hypothetical protein
MYQHDLDAALDDFRASNRAVRELVPDHEYILRDLIGEAVALHLLGRDDEAVARGDALREAFPWRPPDYVGFERAIHAVARAAVGSPADEQQLLLSALPPEITRHTPILYVWLAAFGSLAEMAGDHDVARAILETIAIWPNPLSPMSWEHLRRASGWSLAELADHQRSFNLADADSQALPAGWASLLQEEVSRLRAD